MNCHGNHNKNNDENGQKHKGHLGHMLMMIICCGAPVLILLLVPFLAKVGGPGIGRFLTWVAPFICPLMMLFMIPMMFRGRKSKPNEADSYENKHMQLKE